MAINSNWAKWVKRSVVKHFISQLSGYTVVVEGATHDLTSVKSWIELRVDGPDIFEDSQNSYRLDVNVDLFVTAERDGNAYTDTVIMGAAESAFTHNIKLLDDSNNFVGLMTIVPEGDRRVVITQFGQPTPDTMKMRSSVEGQYRVFLEGN